MVGTLRGMDRDRTGEKIDSLLQLFSMHQAGMPASASYSKGMRQRILLIAAIMDNPDIFIFDEPLSGLDVTSALIFKNLVQALGQHGRMVFYCSHVLEVVEKICYDVLILRKGVVIAQDSVANVGQLLGQSLESTFLHLVDDIDTMSVARDIVTVMKTRRHDRRAIDGTIRTGRAPDRPFWRMVQLFVARIFRGGGDPDSEGLDLGVGLVLTLLALPGGFVSILLFEKYGSLLQWMRGATNVDPFASAVPDEYFLSRFPWRLRAWWRLAVGSHLSRSPRLYESGSAADFDADDFLWLTWWRYCFWWD